MDNNLSMEDQQIIRRLKTIKGHVNAVEKMMVEERPYEDIIVQLEAIRSAVMHTTSVVAQCYAQTCLQETLAKGENKIEALKKPIEILMKVSQHTVEPRYQTIVTEGL